MRKLALRLDDLSVESFETHDTQMGRGTVRGEMDDSSGCSYGQNYTACDLTCEFPCGASGQCTPACPGGSAGCGTGGGPCGSADPTCLTACDLSCEFAC